MAPILLGDPIAAMVRLVELARLVAPNETHEEEQPAKEDLLVES